MSRANISPRKRERILVRYAVVGAPAAPAPEPRVAGGRVSAAHRPARSWPLAAATPAHAPSVSGAVATGAGGAVPDEALAWGCPGCGYVYEVVAGEEREGFAAGTAWSEVPDRWCCPDCGVRDKGDFVAVEPR